MFECSAASFHWVTPVCTRHSGHRCGSGHPRRPPRAAPPAQGIAASMRSDSRFRGGREGKRRRRRPLVGLHNEVLSMLDSPSLPSASRACLSLPEAEDDDQSVRPAPYPPYPVQTAGQQRRAAAPDNSPLRLSLGPIWSSARIYRPSAHDCCRTRLLRCPYPTKTSLAEIALSRWPLTASSPVCLCSTGRSVSRCSMQLTACARMPS